jgi:hypothetical protein
MTIEYVPRTGSSVRGSWGATGGSKAVPAPRHDEVDGLGAVRVPVVSRRVSLPISRLWLVIVLVMNVSAVSRNVRGVRLSVGASFWLTLGLLVALLVVTYRALRLHRFTARDRLDVVLSSAGIHTGGLVVPWSQVEGVVRFGFASGPGRGGPGQRRFVGVRVADFVAVHGMTPARAGLANLTRRRLLVLCEAREVNNPTALAHALDELVENPTARELLGGAEGLRLVTTGPSWRAPRS